jgi:primary-amine oxidase
MAPQPDHPLDPLTAEEIELTRDVLVEKRDLGERDRFMKIDLEEPPKEAVLGRDDGGTDVPREAYVEIRDSAEKETYEAVVSLDDESVVSWDHVPDAQPVITHHEAEVLESVVKADDEWRAAVERRGVEEMDLVKVDLWPAGYDYIPDDVDPTRRLARSLTYVRPHEEGNYYARPLAGIYAHVDLDDMEVVRVVDNGLPDEENPIPSGEGEYRAADRELREDLKPYEVVQPEGTSWEVDGRKVEWQNWHIRVGWSQREGLYLYDVKYEDDGELRDVIYRMGVAEMATPYGDPDPNSRYIMTFDAGEGHLGKLANSLTEGCDCLGVMNYWDAAMNDESGDAMVLPNAICLHEEDYGLLWKRTDYYIENTEVRRNRRLVISFITTVGNYDFAYYYYFYQDGSIEVQIRLTGIDYATVAAQDGDVGGYAELVADQLKAPIHQHWVNFRIDMDIDGQENAIYEVQNRGVPSGPNDEFAPMEEATERSPNPNGKLFYASRRRLDSELDARRMIDPLNGRYWSLVNESETNALDRPVGYKLLPTGDNVEAVFEDNSDAMKRAGFIDNHLWVTPHRDDERWPAGEYPNQNPDTEGLPDWTEADRDIVDEDLVVWYSMGINHITRPEDWPVLPVQVHDFKLEPVNFFDESPAINVPPEHAIRDIETDGE